MCTPVFCRERTKADDCLYCKCRQCAFCKSATETISTAQHYRLHAALQHVAAAAAAAKAPPSTEPRDVPDGRHVQGSSTAAGYKGAAAATAAKAAGVALLTSHLKSHVEHLARALGLQPSTSLSASVKEAASVIGAAPPGPLLEQARALAGPVLSSLEKRVQRIQDRLCHTNQRHGSHGSPLTLALCAG